MSVEIELDGLAWWVVGSGLATLLAPIDRDPLWGWTRSSAIDGCARV